MMTDKKVRIRTARKAALNNYIMFQRGCIRKSGRKHKKQAILYGFSCASAGIRRKAAANEKQTELPDQAEDQSPSLNIRDATGIASCGSSLSCNFSVTYSETSSELYSEPYSEEPYSESYSAACQHLTLRGIPCRACSAVFHDVLHAPGLSRDSLPQCLIHQDC